MGELQKCKFVGGPLDNTEALVDIRLQSVVRNVPRIVRPRIGVGPANRAKSIEFDMYLYRRVLLRTPAVDTIQYHYDEPIKRKKE